MIYFLIVNIYFELSTHQWSNKNFENRESQIARSGILLLHDFSGDSRFFIASLCRLNTN